MSTHSPAPVQLPAPVFYNFQQPHDLIALFTDPQYNHAFMDAWLTHLQSYLVGLRATHMQDRAFGLGEQFLSVLSLVIASPCWEHKLLCLLVWIMSSTQARASLRDVDKVYVNEVFKDQYHRIMWGRAAGGQMLGNQPGQVADTSRIVLRSFVQDQVQIYLCRGYDLK